MWQCPKCGREFKKHNQTHSCRTYTQEEHLKNKDNSVKKLYFELLNIIKEQIGAYKIDAVHCCIHLVSQSTFLAIKPQKSDLKIFFLSRESIKSKRIIRQELYSSNRTNNTLKLSKVEEIDKELIHWIQVAYDLTR